MARFGMGWPYEFTGLTTEQKHLRREALDRYAAIAHFSAFAPAAVFLLVRLARYALRFRPGFAADGHGEYQEVPRSPVVKARRLGVPGGLGARWRMLCWWMADDVYFAGAHWGRRDDWIFGLSWAAWLLALCVVGTGTGQLPRCLISSIYAHSERGRVRVRDRQRKGQREREEEEEEGKKESQTRETRHLATKMTTTA